MVGQENIGFPFFKYAFNLNFDRKKNKSKKAFGPKLVDFPSILIPRRDPNTTQKQGE